MAFVAFTRIRPGCAPANDVMKKGNANSDSITSSGDQHSPFGSEDPIEIEYVTGYWPDTGYHRMSMIRGKWSNTE